MKKAIMTKWKSTKLSKLLRSFCIIKNTLLSIVAITCTTLLSGCDAPMTEKMAPESDHKTVTITTGRNINGKLALQVDFVQVYSKQVFDTLKGMDASLFLTKKQQILLDNPDDVAIWSFDFTKGQSETYSFPTQKNYWGIIIYLHFIDNPQNRIVLPQGINNIRLQIDDGRFRISKDSISTSTVVLDQGGNQ